MLASCLRVRPLHGPRTWWGGPKATFLELPHALQQPLLKAVYTCETSLLNLLSLASSDKAVVVAESNCRRAVIQMDTCLRRKDMGENAKVDIGSTHSYQ